MARTKEGNRIPNNVNQFLGDTRLEKGRWGQGEDSFFLLAWDFAEDCTGANCPMYTKCYYMNTWKSIPCEQTSKCALQQKYLKNVMKAVVDKMKKNKVTEENVIKLGYHLIPLYAQLFKFKMWETHNKDIIIYSQGSPKVHPIYKEMREIIKSLTSVWKDMNSIFKEKADPSKVGDSSFIDAMYSASGESGESPSEDSCEADSKGSGIDFEEGEEQDDEDEDSKDGFEILETENKKKKPRKKQKNYHKRDKRFNKKRSKAGIHVPGYNSRAHRKQVREGGEEPKGERVKDRIKRKKGKKKDQESQAQDTQQTQQTEQPERKRRKRNV